MKQGYVHPQQIFRSVNHTFTATCFGRKQNAWKTHNANYHTIIWLHRSLEVGVGSFSEYLWSMLMDEPQLYCPLTILCNQNRASIPLNLGYFSCLRGVAALLWLHHEWCIWHSSHSQVLTYTWGGFAKHWQENRVQEGNCPHPNIRIDQLGFPQNLGILLSSRCSRLVVTPPWVMHMT